MSRSAAGAYTLPFGDVVTGTAISVSWANGTMDDLETEMGDSLSRSGKGGMSAEFRGVDGAVGAPSLSWTSETSSGWYRASAGNCRFAILGSDVLTVVAAGITVAGTLTVSGAFTLGGTAITSTAAELNILDGVTSTAAELNILDGVTATAAELNFSDGVTSNIQTQLNSGSSYSSATFTTDFAAETTANLSELTNLYYTDVRVAAKVTKAYVDALAITSLGTIGSLVATTADINAGTVDAVIGGTTPADGSFTTLSATSTVTGPSGTWDTGGMDIATTDTYAIAGTDVLNATTLGTGVLASSLTSLGTVASLVATTADINAGTVDAVVGGTTPAAGDFTSVGAGTAGSGAFTTLSTTGALTVGAEIVETVFTIPTSTTPELDPADGTIQTWALTGTQAHTPTDVLVSGESITLGITDGTTSTIVWTSVLAAADWVGGSAPTLDATGATWVELWHDGTHTHAALIGVTS